MTSFVILAAGRGTRIGRVGDSLHKALVPLGQQAVLSHLLDLAPDNSRIIICLGHRGDQIRTYVRLAHPKLQVTFVNVKGWDKVGGGPGLSLLAARHEVGDGEDMVFTSCDTLWTANEDLWSGPSWAGVASVPIGTMPERWCRLVDVDGRVTRVLDKVPEGGGSAYVGLARIISADLPVFWDGVQHGSLLANELQVSGGLEALSDQRRLDVRHVHWIDVGDEVAYRRAVAQVSGYDWTKLNEATYVLPEEGRVVKFWDDWKVRDMRARRARTITSAVPAILDAEGQMLAYEYIPGVVAYDTITAHQTRALLRWADQSLWNRVRPPGSVTKAALSFYRDKTIERIQMLDGPLYAQCRDAVERINWEWLVNYTMPVTFHGDFNFGNIIIVKGGSFVGIDWRQDFAGQMWGDQRYDIAKLLAGTVVHWGNARRGDFRPWDEGAAHAAVIREWMGNRPDIEMIGALSLLNSAPLHASPLDEVLVARGMAWIEDTL